MILTVLKYAVPVLCYRLGTNLLNIAVVIIVGHLGLVQLAAYGLANPLYITVYLVALSYLMIFSVRASKLKDHMDHLSSYVIASLIFALALSLIMIIILLILPSLLPFLGQKAHISHLASGFLYCIVLGMPPAICGSVLNQCLVVLKYPIVVTVIAFLEFLIGTLAIYSLAHYSQLGLKGVALGLAVTYWFKILITVAYLYCRGQHGLKLKLITREELLDHTGFLLKLGWPISIQYGGELLAGSIASLMIGDIYSNALAAQQAAVQIRVFFLMLPIALSQACAILISKASTQEVRPDYFKSILKSALMIGCVTALVLITLINYYFTEYIGLFIHHSSHPVIGIARIFVVITSLTILVEIVKYTCMGVMRAFENTKVPMQYSLLVYWLISIPLAYLLGYHTSMQAIGVPLGMFIGLTLSVILLAGYSWRLVDQKG